MLFKRFVGCIYRSLRELCTTPQCAVLLVSRWTRNTHTFAISRNERKLEHSTQLMTMTYGPKKYHPSSCVAPRRKLTMACGRITNFPSCVARRPLCHLIMTCDHNTTLSSYEAQICVEHLHSVDQIRADEAIKYNRSIVQSSKSGSGSILLYYASKSRRAQSSVQISINDSQFWITPNYSLTNTLQSSVTILVPVHFPKQQQADIKTLTHKISLIRIIKSQLFYLFLTLFKQVQLYYFLHLLFLKWKQTTQAVSITNYNKESAIKWKHIYIYVYF